MFDQWKFSMVLKEGGLWKVRGKEGRQAVVKSIVQGSPTFFHSPKIPECLPLLDIKHSRA
jgi:hypothetical protein